MNFKIKGGVAAFSKLRNDTAKLGKKRYKKLDFIKKWNLGGEWEEVCLPKRRFGACSNPAQRKSARSAETKNP